MPRRLTENSPILALYNIIYYTQLKVGCIWQSFFFSSLECNFCISSILCVHEISKNKFVYKNRQATDIEESEALHGDMY